MNRRKFLEMVSALSGTAFVDLPDAKKTTIKQFRQKHRLKIDGVDFSEYVDNIDVNVEQNYVVKDGEYISGLRDETVILKLRDVPFELNRPLFKNFTSKGSVHLEFKIPSIKFNHACIAYIIAFTFNYNIGAETILEMRRAA